MKIYIKINYTTMFFILLFFWLTIGCFCINLIFYSYKRRKYYLNRIKLLIFGVLLTATISLITNLPFFIANNSESFIDKEKGFFLPTILFNFANILYSSSVILFLLSFLEIDETIIDLEIPAQLSNKRGNIPIGRILKGKAKKQKFYLALKDLEKHMFICGATGTGKSNFLQNFLINFRKIYKIPFFLVEFKGEYHFLQKRIENVLILWPGVNFSINIFNPGEVSPIIHAERIFDILKSGKFLDENAEFSPQMEKVLVELLVKVCENKNFRSWKGFEYFCKEYLKKNKHQIPMLNQTLISIKNRIRRFSVGPLRTLFENRNQIEISDLFKKNVLLDLSSIIRLGGEKEDALFFLNMILKYLWDRNLTKGAYNFDGIQHITIIEDAQYFAPQDVMKKNRLTTYLEDIALLQRGTGECLITLATRPNISKEILANNGVVLTFKNHIEKDIMCDLLNINIENKNFLSILEEGQCIIRTNSVKEPFLLKIPLIRQESLTVSEIKKNNKLVLNIDGKRDTSISKTDTKPNQNILQKTMLKFKKIFSNNSKIIVKNAVDIKLNNFQNYSRVVNNSDLENIKAQNNIELDSFHKLEDYINRICKLHKKKEEI